MSISSVSARFAADALIERQRLIKRLRSTDQPAAIVISELLENCSPEAPCRSAACPVCGGDLQLAVVELVNREIKTRAREIRGRMHLGTVVPLIGCVEPGELTIKVCRRVKSAVAKALIECGIPPCIASIEISFNEDNEGKIPPHWCVHVHWVGVDWLTDRQQKALTAYFPSSPLNKKPVLCLPLDKKKEGRFYAFKWQHVRRVSYIVPAKEDTGRSAYRATHRYQLRPQQSVTVALIEHQLGYGGRLIGHGIDDDAVKAVMDALKWARDGP